MCTKFVKSLITFIVLVVSLTYVQNQVTRNELLEDRSIRQPFGEIIADIINMQSHGTEYKDVEGKRNFTAPGRRIGETIFRIVGGGRPALYGEFSHMGAVGWRSYEYGDQWVYKCGASLISDKFLITAAHCPRLSKFYRSVNSYEPEVVNLGDKFINNKYSLNRINRDNCPSDFEATGSWEDGDNIESRIIRIDKFIKHPEYVSPRHYYDIAIIELQERVDFGPLIRPACLWNSHDTSAFGNISVSGWGETNPFTGEISDELQVGNIGLINDRFCDTLLKKKRNRKWRGLSDHQLCAGVLSGRVDTCRGDSGGPLQTKINISLRWPVYHLIGVTSFSYGCMHTNVPGVYVCLD